MKKLLTLLLILFSLPHIYSQQTWDLSKQFNCDNEIKIEESFFDEALNDFFIAGYFNGTLYLENDTLTSSLRDFFIARMDTSLNIKWFKQIASGGADFSLNMSIDNEGIYLGGNILFSQIFFTEQDSLDYGGKADCFAAKYTKNGDFEWATSLGQGASKELIKYISTDHSGNIYALVEYLDSIKINDTIYNAYKGNSVNNNLAIKINNNTGSIDAIHNFLSSEDSKFQSIYSKNDDVFMAGKFGGKLYLHDDSITNNSGSQDIFILNTNKDLSQTNWTRRTYGINTDNATTITIDEYDNIYLSGFFGSDSLIIDTNNADRAIDHLLHNNGKEDLFVFKLNENGHFQFAKTYGCAGNDWGRKLIVHNEILLLTGYFEDQIIFGEDTLNSNDIDDKNFYFGLIDDEGNPLGAKTLTQQGTGVESGISISATKCNKYLVSGTFQSDTIRIGDSTLINGGNTNTFVARYDPSLSATFTEEQDISCYGVQDGALTAEAYFGTPPYHYEWNTGDTTQRIFDLSAGNYTVTITDALENNMVRNASLTEPDPIIIDTIAVSDLACYSDQDGSIDIDVSGGAGNFSYAWDGPGSGIVSYAQDQSGLGGGVFTVTVTDGNECNNTASFTVNAPDPIQLINTLVTPVDPPGSSNGAIDITPTGGQGDTTHWTYSWDAQSPLTFTASTQDIENLDGGIYNLALTDSAGCTYDTSFVVNDSAILIAYINNIQHVTCKGDSNGYASLAILNDEGSLKYKWENNIGDSIANSASVNNLAAGNYYVTVADQTLNDSAYASLTILEAGSSLKIDQVQTIDIDCFGDGDGLVEIQASGGKKPYSYNWSNGSTTEDLTGMDAGTFYLTITDNYGCQLDTFASINEPSAITLTDTILQEISCNGLNNGIIEVNASGGTGTKSYRWNDPKSQVTKRASELYAGQYTITVTDAAECKVNTTINLSEPDALVINPTVQQISCFGETDGIIFTSAEGGNTPYTYQWNKDGSLFATGPNQTGLEEAAYSLTITDENNCKENGSYSITEPTEITINQVEKTNVTGCWYNENGMISVDVSGGTGSLNYTLQPAVLPANDSGIFHNLPGDKYVVEVSDANDCGPFETDSQHITTPSPITIDSIKTNESSGTTDGSIEAYATGGTGSLKYILNLNDTNTTGTFEELGSGDYDIRLLDQNNCILDTNNISIGLSSIDDIRMNNESITVYPVPVNDILTIRVRNKAEVVKAIKVTNQEGKQLLTLAPEEKNETYKVNLKNLNPGSYLINIQTSKRRYTKVIIKK